VRIEINEIFCTGCALCIEFCPTKVLEPAQELNQRGVYVPTVVRLDKCTACKICELYCPNFAIAIGKDGQDG